MYLASKLRLAFHFALAVLFIGGGLLLATPGEAEAKSSSIQYSATGHAQRLTSPALNQASFPVGVFAQPAAQPTIRTVQNTDTSLLADGACTVADGIIPFSGSLFSHLTGKCNTPVTAVLSAAGDALDCAKSPMECMTNWVYGVIGGVVSWSANGVVTLATGIHTECIPDGGSSGTQVSTSACEARIAMDYFPAGSDYSQEIGSAIQDANAAETRRVTRELARTTSEAKREEYQRQLELLRTSAADQAASVSGTSQIAANSVFYTPRSPVSTSTFDREYGKYALIGIMLLVPMVIAAALQSVITGKGALMARSVVINLPLAIFGMIVSPTIIRILLGITDSFSAYVLADVREDIDGFFTQSTDNPATMGITMLLPFGIVALIFAFAAMMVWFVLNMREASVALISVFMPLAFAASVWPALSKWVIRAIKLLMAAIISKVFIVGALSLGIGTFSGATSAADEAGAGGMSFSHLIYGATIFAIAAFSPSIVLKIFDEIGDAASSLNNGQSGAFAKGMQGLNLGANLPSTVDGIKRLTPNKGGGGAAAAAGAVAGGGFGGPPGGGDTGGPGGGKPGSGGPGGGKPGAGGPGGSKPGGGSGWSSGALAAIGPSGNPGGKNSGPSNDPGGGGLGGAGGSDPGGGGLGGAGGGLGGAGGSDPGGSDLGGSPGSGVGSGGDPSQETRVLPQQPNFVARAGAKAYADGVHRGSGLKRMVGAVGMGAGHLGRPLTVAWPVAGVARGIGTARRDMQAVRNIARDSA